MPRVQIALMVIQTVVLALTAVIVVWYTNETKKLRKEAEKETEAVRKANTFSTIVEIHRRLCDEKSYAMRQYVHATFIGALRSSVDKVLGPEYLIMKDPTQKISVERVFERLRESEKELTKFNTDLTRFKSDDGSYTALDAVERTLLDFDLIGLAVCMGIESAMKIAEAYRPVIQRTAKEILPFVAIQKQLRAGSDPEYKKHYLCLLRKLGIDTQGVEVPCDRKPEECEGV